MSFLISTGQCTIVTYHNLFDKHMPIIYNYKAWTFSSIGQCIAITFCEHSHKHWTKNWNILKHIIYITDRAAKHISITDHDFHLQHWHFGAPIPHWLLTGSQAQAAPTLLYLHRFRTKTCFANTTPRLAKFVEPNPTGFLSRSLVGSLHWTIL